MAEKIYGLAEPDRTEFKRLVDERRQNKRPRGHSDSVDEENSQAPETYIALIPPEGIDELIDDEPGSALCDIYRIADVNGFDVLIPLDIQKRVYNLSASAVEGDLYLPVTRAKSGHWLAVQNGGGNEGGTATKAKYINFTLSSALTTAQASKTGCTVNFYWGGGTNPGATVTVWNQPASSNYIFASGNGKRGLASYDAANDKYWILNTECP